MNWWPGQKHEVGIPSKFTDMSFCWLCPGSLSSVGLSVLSAECSVSQAVTRWEALQSTPAPQREELNHRRPREGKTVMTKNCTVLSCSLVEASWQPFGVSSLRLPYGFQQWNSSQPALATSDLTLSLLFRPMMILTDNIPSSTQLGVLRHCLLKWIHNLFVS